MKFNCSGCGSCCKRVGANITLLKSLGFPYGVKADGRSCEMLTDDNKCSVYLNRPDICNVDKQYYINPANKGKTKKEVFLQESIICNKFMDEDGVDIKLRVNEKLYQ